MSSHTAVRMEMPGPNSSAAGLTSTPAPIVSINALQEKGWTPVSKLNPTSMNAWRSLLLSTSRIWRLRSFGTEKICSEWVSQSVGPFPVLATSFVALTSRAISTGGVVQVVKCCSCPPIVSAETKRALKTADAAFLT